MAPDKTVYTYWVMTSTGAVDIFADVTNHGDVSSMHLNGEIIAASGT